MEFFESIGWIALGFVPTLAAMELGWKVTKGLKLSKAKAIVVEKKVSMESDLV
ncbi:MAG TPA: hypothetical protein VIP70_05470 [Nitrososphaeraceae archaeon]